MESYKNILANKFMRDTNYIIIKDTDDLEELERQYELFNSQLTMRQQRLSDDRSIEIWNMTNKEHYEALKIELMKKIDSKFGDEDSDKEYSTFSYDPEEEISDDEITSILNADLDSFEIPDDDNDITEPVKEDSTIPIENNDNDITSSEPKHYNSFLKNNQDIQKDNMADQYEIDTNMHIIGRVTGGNVDDYLSNLEKSFINFNAQTHDHRKKSDDKCREIYGMSNIERYNKLKADALKFKSVKTVEKVTSTDNETLDSSKVQQLGEFVSQVYDNMQAVNEVENLKVNKHRRFNDTPYFTPTELIDMGVHGNHNFYSNEPDNDGLITNIKVATWFDSYKDMCMDHIFEDYRKEWIDTLDMLYSDFEDIKSSGNEEKILARKQSILDLGWNPEIPFNRKNRLKASKRVSKILDETIPRDIFINLDDIAEEDDIVEEQITKQTHKPVLLIFTQGKTPVISQGIKFFTGSNYSHASISFDPELNEVYSYNMRGENFGFVRENLSSFKDNVISVMAFFAPNHIVESLKNKVNDFKDNKTTFDLRIFLNKILHIDHKVSKNEYNQVCSTFVDTVLKSGGINLVGDIEIPDPGQLYNASKSVPNKIIEVFNDIATKYNGKSVKRKLNTLYNKNINDILESVSSLKSAEYNDVYHNIELWESGKSNLLWITGLSGSGKSTISKEIAEEYGAEYIELDNLQRAKMGNWDTTDNEVLDSYIKSVGGLYNVFPYCNTLSTVTWKDVVSEENKCHEEFSRFFEYLIQYAKKHKDRKFVVEGVQIAYNTTNAMIKKISEYPVIIKMNGPLKTEFRREKRSIKYGIERGDSFIQIFSHVAGHIRNWVKGKFYLDNYDDLKYFKNYLGEATLPTGVTLRNATKDDTDNMFKWEMESVDKGIRNDPKVIKYIEKDVQDSIKITKMIMYNGETIGMFTTDRLNDGYWYIGEIYIVKEHRNKGIGTALLKDEISKHDKIKLQVAQSNHGAMKLYKSLGFEITDRNDEGKLYIMTLDKKEKPIKESVQYITEEQGPRREVAMTKNLIDFYKESTKDWEIGLKHLRWNNNVRGVMILSDDWGPIKDEDRKLLGYVAVEKQEEGNMIIGLEVSPHYSQIGTGSYLLYLAENELGATLLSVNKSNDKAIKMYKNNGWSEYKTSDEMIFMQKVVQENKDFVDSINEAYLYGIVTESKKKQRKNDKGETVPNECPKCGSKIGVFFAGEPIFKCTNKECKQYFGVVPFKESTSVLNEVKRFPIEFDKEGNLIIYKARVGSLAFGDEIDDSVQLLQAYRNAANVEGIKYELAKLWYINDCIEKKLKKRLSNDEYKELIDTRATCLNVFKTNLDYVMKAEKGFNFSDYYNSTPFSDNSTKITANTLKYTVKTIANMI